MRAAIALLFILCCFIKSFTFSATARLSAAACTSSCKPCFFRKLSKLLPRCLFLFLAAFDVGIFSSQSQSSVLLWSFLCLLDESHAARRFRLRARKIMFVQSVSAVCCELPRCRTPSDRPAACQVATEIAQS